MSKDYGGSDSGGVSGDERKQVHCKQKHKIVGGEKGLVDVGRDGCGDNGEMSYILIGLVLRQKKKKKDMKLEEEEEEKS